MELKITELAIEDFLTVRDRGPLTYEQALVNLQKVADVWRKNLSENILVDIRSRELQLSIQEIRLLFDAIHDLGMGYLNKVAVVRSKSTQYSHVDFFEFLAKFKGMEIKAFDDHEEAIDWLSKKREIYHEAEAR